MPWPWAKHIQTLNLLNIGELLPYNVICPVKETNTLLFADCLPWIVEQKKEKERGVGWVCSSIVLNNGGMKKPPESAESP